MDLAARGTGDKRLEEGAGLSNGGKHGLSWYGTESVAFSVSMICPGRFLLPSRCSDSASESGHPSVLISFLIRSFI